MPTENNNLFNAIALALSAKKNLIKANISEKSASQIADVTSWTGQHSNALAEFAANWQDAKSTRDDEVIALLQDAITKINTAADLVAASDDGDINDILALENEIKSNYDEFQIDIIAAEAVLEAARTEEKDRIGSVDDFNSTYAMPSPPVSLTDPSGEGMKMIVTIPKVFTLGDLQSSLDPSYEGDDKFTSWGYLTLPAGVTDIAGAKSALGISNDSFVLEDNFADMKGYIAEAREGTYEAENFEFYPHNVMGVPAPEGPGDIIQWYWTHKQSQKFSVAVIHSVSSDNTSPFGDITPDKEIFLTGTAAVKGADKNLHDVDLSSVPNVFHHIAIDLDHVTPELADQHESIKTIFFKPSTDTENQYLWNDSSIEVGTSLFKEYLSTNGHIYPLLPEYYDELIHNLKTKYGTFMHNFQDDFTFQNLTWTIAEAFGWDMSTFISNNGDLYNFFTSTLKASKQMIQDYSYHANPINSDAIIVRSIFGYENIAELDKAMDKVSEIKSKTADSLGKGMSDGESFITYLANDENAAQNAITAYTIDRVTQRANFWSNRKQMKFMNWNTAFQGIEFCRDVANKGNLKVKFNTAEIENSIIHHSPVIEGFGADGAVNWHVEAEKNTPYLPYSPNGTGPMAAGYMVSGPYVEGDCTYWIMRNNYHSWTPHVVPLHMVSDREHNVMTYSGDSTNHTLALVWNSAGATIESITSWIEYMTSKGGNMNTTAPYISTSGIGDDAAWGEFIDEIEKSGLVPELKWAQKIGNNGAWSNFGSGAFNVDNAMPMSGNGMRDLVTGEQITKANALEWWGLNLSSWSMSPLQVYGNIYSQQSWKPSFQHLASDFVSSYTEGMDASSLTGKTLFYGNYAGWTHTQLGSSLGTIVKNFYYDDSQFGRISNEVLDTDKFYVSNEPYNTYGLLELDTYGNHTSVDMSTDEFISGEYYTSNQGLYDIPQELGEWITSQNDSSYIEYKKLAKDNTGKVFPMYSRIATSHMKEEGKFKPIFLDNGINKLNLFQGLSSSNFLHYYLTNIKGLYYTTNSTANDMLDKITNNEITINLPAWNGLEAVSYTKPKGTSLAMDSSLGNLNGNWPWDDNMLPMFEYLHKAFRMLIKHESFAGKKTLPFIPAEEWRAKVLSEGKTWQQYILYSLNSNDGMAGFNDTDGFVLGDATADQIIRKHGYYSESTSAFYWTNTYYRLLFALRGSFTSHHELTLNDDGSVVIDVIEPFLLNVTKGAGSNAHHANPYTFRIKGINETPTGAVDTLSKHGDVEVPVIDVTWDLELYTGHLSSLNNFIHPYLQSEPTIQGLVSGASSSDLAITEIGGDGMYVNMATTLSQTAASPLGTNKILPGDIDSDGDEVGDLCDLYPENAKDSFDIDGDGTGNNQDLFPFSTVANWSVLEDVDGNLYKTYGDLSKRGWIENGIKIIELPQFINLAEAGYDDSIYTALNDNEVEGQLILKYVASSIPQPTEGILINLNKVNGGPDNFLDGDEAGMWDITHHIVASGITTSHEPMSNEVTADYKYATLAVGIDPYTEKFSNGTITFEEVDAYLIAKENIVSKQIRYRFFDSYGDGGININYPVEIKDEAGNVIDSITFNNYTGWSTDNSIITHADGTTHNYWTLDGKKVWKSEILELNTGNYTLNFTADSYAHLETSVLILNVAENGDETPFTGGGTHAGSYNVYGSLTRNAANSIPFTVS